MLLILHVHPGQYLDRARTWHVSALSRTETHGKKRHTAIRPENNFSLKWGIGTQLSYGMKLGVSGSYQWQCTDDSGSDASWNRGTRERTVAIGAAIPYMIQPIRLHCILRVQAEFGVADRPRGNVASLVLTKFF